MLQTHNLSAYKSLYLVNSLPYSY